MNYIPYGKQNIDDDDIEAVVNVLKADYLTGGSKVEEFENILSKFCESKYTVAVSNGTAALHLASLVLLSKGDKVLTTPNSFLATSNAILYAGATPIFVDICEDGNIDLDLCEDYLKNDSNVKAIYGVYFSGNPLNQKKLRDLRNKYNVIILEDCAHAMGAEYDNIRAGSCTYSDCSIFSFHPVKHMTTGEGGAITTNSFEIYQKLISLRNHGMIRSAESFKNIDMAYDEKGNKNPWYYEMHDLGYNYRITDFQCALGISQIKRLPAFLKRRHEIAFKYTVAFQNSKFILPSYDYSKNSAYHLYVVKIDFFKLKITKAEMFMKMKERNIGLQMHYIPINKQPFYTDLGYGNEHTPKMDKYYKSAFSLPIYYSLSDEEQSYVINTLTDIIDEYS